MPDYVKVVKSPTHEGIENIPANIDGDFVTVNIMLPNGNHVTNIEQFQDDESELVEEE